MTDSKPWLVRRRESLQSTWSHTLNSSLLIAAYAAFEPIRTPSIALSEQEASLRGDVIVDDLTLHRCNRRIWTPSRGSSC